MVDALWRSSPVCIHSLTHQALPLRLSHTEGTVAVEAVEEALACDVLDLGTDLHVIHGDEELVQRAFRRHARIQQHALFAQPADIKRASDQLGSHVKNVESAAAAWVKYGCMYHVH